MNYISITNVDKVYPKAEKKSVDDFNLEITKGEFIVFVGPSGCGKSTTLRMISGLEDLTEGKIFIDGNDVTEAHPKDRDIAMVFQNYALYPHMTIYENIAFGLKHRKEPKEEIEKKVQWAVQILGLEEYVKRKPKDLSGGQRQRVALGRAIVRNPKLFLMDEPLSNLDAKLRVSMRNEITKLHKSLGATTIYVTHDQVEAMTMADRIVVMKDGLIQQVGTPLELFDNPSNLFVAGFIGSPQMNLLEVTVDGDVLTFANGQTITLPEGVLKQLNHAGELVVGFRPEHTSTSKVVLDNFPDQVITISVDNVEIMGSDNFVFSTIGESNVIVKTLERTFEDSITIRVDVNKLHFFDKVTGERL